jgi:glycosyltransferase involved in cell wall biosynthesis
MQTVTNEHRREVDSARRAGLTRTSPVRVLMVAPSLDILGGQSIQAQRLLLGLQLEETVSVRFLACNPPLPGPLRLLQRVKYLRTIVTSLAYIALLLMRIPQCDVVHVFSASYYSFLLAPTPAILIARLFRKRIVLNYRSGEAEDHLARWHSAVSTIRLVDAIAVPSGYLVDVFARFGLTARSIYNFVDTNRFKFRTRKPLQPVFLANRNLEPMYNVACILKAFAIIQARFPGGRLTVVGDGSQRAELESLGRQLELRNVEFVGRVTNERMQEICDQADIYLNSPNIDNMPGSVIEAFASGLPVVTSEAGGIPYIVKDGETGLLVRCDDHEAMGAAAIRLLEDAPLADAIVRQARAECAKYAWEAVRDDWLALYDELCDLPAGKRAQERRS